MRRSVTFGLRGDVTLWYIVGMDLSQWLDREGLTAAQFAERIGVSRPAVIRYRSRQRLPQPAILKRIVEATRGDVTFADFYADGREASAAE